jgi:hypothetical protein
MDMTKDSSLLRRLEIAASTKKEWFADRPGRPEMICATLFDVSSRISHSR